MMRTQVCYHSADPLRYSYKDFALTKSIIHRPEHLHDACAPAANIVPVRHPIAPSQFCLPRFLLDQSKFLILDRRTRHLISRLLDPPMVTRDPIMYTGDHRSPTVSRFRRHGCGLESRRPVDRQLWRGRGDQSLRPLGLGEEREYLDPERHGIRWGAGAKRENHCCVYIQTEHRASAANVRRRYTPYKLADAVFFLWTSDFETSAGPCVQYFGDMVLETGELVD